MQLLLCAEEFSFGLRATLGAPSRRRHRQPRPRRHRQPRRGVGTVSAPRVAASGQQAPRVQVCAEGVELLSCAVEFGFRFGLRVIPSGSPVPASAPSAPRRATGTVSLVAASGRQAPRVQVWAEGVELLSLCAVEFTLGFYSEWRGQKPLLLAEARLCRPSLT